MIVTRSQMLVWAVMAAILCEFMFFGFRASTIGRTFAAISMAISGVLVITIAVTQLLKRFHEIPKFALLIASYFLVLIILALPQNQAQAVSALANPLMHWAYIMPLATLIAVRASELSKTFDVLNVVFWASATTALPIIIIAPESSILLGVNRIMELFPVLIVHRYMHGKRGLLFLIFVYSTPLLVTSLVTGKRVDLLFIVLFGLLFFLMVTKRDQHTLTNLWRWSVITVSFALVLALLTQYEKIQALFPTYTIDTRTFLFEEMQRELTGWDLAFGRGVFGTYYSEYFWQVTQRGDIGDHFDRTSVEVALLHFLLKGGVFGVVLITAVSITGIRRLLKAVRFDGKIDEVGLYSPFLICIVVCSLISFYPVYSGFWLIFWLVLGVYVPPQRQHSVGRR